MKDNSKRVVYVPLSSITPDPNQPRKSFDASRLAELASSITKHGIINPMIVELQSDGYLLVDGERRYRAAKIAKLKEVPVVVVDSQSPSDRLIQQFHLQEQHQGWSSTEKAVAVVKLSEQLKVPIAELARELSMSQRTIGDYISFAQILGKNEFQKNEMPLTYARQIVSLRTFVKKELMKKEEDEFTIQDEKDLEAAIISRVKDGSMKKVGDFTRIHDSVKTDPTVIRKFIRDDKLTSDKLFLQSKAKAAWLARNIVNQSRQISTFVPQAASLGAYKLVEKDSAEHTSIKNAYKNLGEYLKLIN